MADAPAAALQVALVSQIPLRAQEQRQLERLFRQSRQVGELEERHAFGVLVSFLGIDDPVVRIPDRDRRERPAGRIGGVRPALQTHGGADVMPAETAIGNLATGLPDGLPGGEVDIVSRHGELSATGPELEQPRIDVHQRRAPEACQQARIDRVVEVQQQVGALVQRFGFVAAHDQVFRGPRGREVILAIREIQGELATEPVGLRPRTKRCQRRRLPFRLALGAKAFQPIHVAPELAEAQDVLQVDPGVSAAVREVGDIER